jgi:hypothetical protein
MFSATFAFFIAQKHFLPGAPWYLAAFLLFGALLAAWIVAPKQKPLIENLTVEQLPT